jgi:hypothetical protein
MHTIMTKEVLRQARPVPCRQAGCEQFAVVLLRSGWRMGWSGACAQHEAAVRRRLEAYAQGVVAHYTPRYAERDASHATPRS